MEDYMLVIRAQNARSEMQEAKKRIKAETRRKYEAMMNADMAEAIEDVELKFARVLAEVHDAGVTQGILRREVLRTNVWNTWTYWRDKANIEPERVTISNARAEKARAEAPFVWNDDYTVLTVRRDPAGNALPTPVDLDRGSMFAMAGKHWFMEGAGEENVKLNNAYFREHKLAWAKMLDAEITKQFEAGNLADLPAKQ